MPNAWMNTCTYCDAKRMIGTLDIYLHVVDVTLHFIVVRTRTKSLVKKVLKYYVVKLQNALHVLLVVVYLHKCVIVFETA